MVTQRAPGLTADWLNAWLAAIGVTVLVPGAKLRWTSDVRPVAEFDLPGEDPAEDVIAAHLPSVDDLDRLVIARRIEGVEHEFSRNVSLHAYQERAALARRTGDFSLGVSVTDLRPGLDAGNLPHSPFDPSAPRGETLYSRLRRCVEALAGCEARRVGESMRGQARRVRANGLGFDFRRIASGSHPDAEKHVDPAVEVLAFFGLALFPVRGGLESERTAGWSGRPSRRGAFQWPTWSPWLDRWGIDAPLDRARSLASAGGSRSARFATLGVEVMFGSIAYDQTGKMDATRAYASERLW